MQKIRLLVICMGIVLIALPVLGSCGEKEVVKEVIKEVPIEKEVVKEVVKEVPVEKEVVKEVEKEVVKEVLKEGPTKFGEPVKIGMELGLTGAYAAEHKLCFLACQDYTRYINEQGGIRDTAGVAHMVEFKWGDMKMAAPTSISLYEKAKADGVLAYNTAWTAATDALKPRIDKDQILTCACSASHAAVVPHGSMFITFPYHEDIIGASVQWYKETQWDKERAPKVAIIAIDVPFGRIALQDAVLDYIQGIGVEFVGSELVDLVPVDVTANLLKIKEAGADFIFGQVVGPTAAVILRDMQKMGLEIPLVCNPAASYRAVIKMAGEAANGCFVTCGSPFLGDAHGIELARELQLNYHGEVIEDDAYVSWFLPALKIEIEAIRQAMQQVPFEELTRQAVIDFGFEQMENFETGVVPPVTFTNGRRYGQNQVIMVQVQNGQPAFVSDWFACPDVMGYQEYYEEEVAHHYK